MKYEEKLKKYLNGELSPEEAQEIQADIEKFQVLLEHMDEQIDEKLFEGEDEDWEKLDENTPGRKVCDLREEKAQKGQVLNKQISRAVNSKFRRYAIVTGAIVVVVVLAVLQGLSPLLDRICYNPNRSVEIIDEETQSAIVYSPFNMTMMIYMELFCGDQGFADVSVWPEGYGRYTLDVQTQINGRIKHRSLELVRNHLYQQDIMWDSTDMPDNAFSYRSFGEYCGINKEAAAIRLSDIPETYKMRAAVSFKDLKDTSEIMDFMQAHEVRYLYFPLVTNDETSRYDRYLGFSPKDSGYVLTDLYDQEKYPYLDLFQCSWDAITEEIYEEHVTSMLKYMLEQEDFLRTFDSIVPGERIASMNRYQEALDYIEANGLCSYGTVVYGSKSEILELMEDPAVDGIYLIDGDFEL